LQNRRLFREIDAEKVTQKVTQKNVENFFRSQPPVLGPGATANLHIATTPALRKARAFFKIEENTVFQKLTRLLVVL
jgi:hypothetical protein